MNCNDCGSKNEATLTRAPKQKREEKTYTVQSVGTIETAVRGFKDLIVKATK
jgi:hypothetical protein